jgi:hypothetical protein
MKRVFPISSSRVTVLNHDSSSNGEIRVDEKRALKMRISESTLILILNLLTQVSIRFKKQLQGEALKYRGVGFDNLKPWQKRGVQFPNSSPG